MEKEKAVLAYSGGLDTSVCIKYLQNLHNLEVITVTVDCGQNDDFKELENKAKLIGAIKHYHIDAKEEFVRDFIVPSIKANGLYQDKYPLATALARPLIAKKTVEIANQEGCKFISHGCTGKGNDQVRFDITIRSINPNLKIIAPIRDMNLTRDVEIKFAKEHKIPIDAKVNKYSIDENIWGRSIEGNDLEDPNFEPPQECFKFVKQISNGSARIIEIEFLDGIPISLDGVKMKLQDLILELNQICGNFGVGIVDHIEDRIVGIKSREIYESPAALAIIEAHKDLEKMVLTSHELQFKKFVDDKWSWLAYSGLWQEPLKKDLDKFIQETQKRVTGKVRIKLQSGSMRVIGRQSIFSLYKNDLATYSSDSSFDQDMARGFVELWGLQSITANSIIMGINLNLDKNNLSGEEKS